MACSVRYKSEGRPLLSPCRSDDDVPTVETREEFFDNVPTIDLGMQLQFFAGSSHQEECQLKADPGPSASPEPRRRSQNRRRKRCRGSESDSSQGDRTVAVTDPYLMLQEGNRQDVTRTRTTSQVYPVQTNENQQNESSDDVQIITGRSEHLRAKSRRIQPTRLSKDRKTQYSSNQQKEAFVSIVWTDGGPKMEHEVINILIAGQSLQRHARTRERILFTATLANFQKSTNWQYVSKYWKVKKTFKIRPHESWTDSAEPRFREVFTKIAPLGEMKEYEKIVILDTDILVASKDVEELFGHKHCTAYIRGNSKEPFKTSCNNKTGGINAGVMVIDPRKCNYDAMREELDCSKNMKAKLTGPEQDYLARCKYLGADEWDNLHVKNNFQPHQLKYVRRDDAGCDRERTGSLDVVIWHFSGKRGPNEWLTYDGPKEDLAEELLKVYGIEGSTSTATQNCAKVRMAFNLWHEEFRQLEHLGVSRRPVRLKEKGCPRQIPLSPTCYPSIEYIAVDTDDERQSQGRGEIGQSSNATWRHNESHTRQWFPPAGEIDQSSNSPWRHNESHARQWRHNESHAAKSSPGRWPKKNGKNKRQRWKGKRGWGNQRGSGDQRVGVGSGDQRVGVNAQGKEARYGSSRIVGGGVVQPARPVNPEYQNHTDPSVVLMLQQQRQIQDQKQQIQDLKIQQILQRVDETSMGKKFTIEPKAKQPPNPPPRQLLPAGSVSKAASIPPPKRPDPKVVCPPPKRPDPKVIPPRKAGSSESVVDPSQSAMLPYKGIATPWL